MKRIKEHTDSITAHDAAGRAYRIDVYTDFLHTTTLDGAAHKVPGMVSLMLDGQSVNLLDALHAQVVLTGLHLTLDRPLKP